jgi:hypothetical protein
MLSQESAADANIFAARNLSQILATIAGSLPNSSTSISTGTYTIFAAIKIYNHDGKSQREGQGTITKMIGRGYSLRRYFVRIHFTSGVRTIVLINCRAFMSVYSKFFSEENDAKRRWLEVEECRLSLNEKAQVIEMVKANILSPRTACRMISRIDDRTNQTTQYHKDSSESQIYIEPWTRSPSPGRRSLTWGIEDANCSPNRSEDEI